MSGIKSFVGKKLSKSVKFMEGDLKIFKLTTDEVKTIQTLANESQEKFKKAKSAAEAAGEEFKGVEDEDGLLILKKVIALGAEGGDQLDDNDFDNLPLDELSKLSSEIMKYSGVAADQGK